MLQTRPLWVLARHDVLRSLGVVYRIPYRFLAALASLAVSVPNIRPPCVLNGFSTRGIWLIEHQPTTETSRRSGQATRSNDRPPATGSSINTAPQPEAHKGQSIQPRRYFDAPGLPTRTPPAARSVAISGRTNIRHLHVLNSVLAAPATRTIRGIPTELRLGTGDGMPTDCVASFDNLRVVPKAYLSTRSAHCSRPASPKHAPPSKPPSTARQNPRSRQSPDSMISITELVVSVQSPVLRRSNRPPPISRPIPATRRIQDHPALPSVAIIRTE